VSNIKLDKARSSNANSFLTNTNLDPVVFVADQNQAYLNFHQVV